MVGGVPQCHHLPVLGREEGGGKSVFRASALKKYSMISLTESFLYKLSNMPQLHGQRPERPGLSAHRIPHPIQKSMCK